MRRNGIESANENAGAIWVWSACVVGSLSLVLLMPLLHYVYLTLTGSVFAMNEELVLLVTLDAALVAGLLVSRRRWHMEDDIRVAWLHLWRWALAFCGIVLGLVLGLASGLTPLVIFAYLVALSLAFVMLGERQARLAELGEVVSRLAQGDFEAQVDVGQMRGDLVEMSERLNQVAGAASAAAEERARALREALEAEQVKTRAERMRTELITNVSHDLKTPLTSVINYADLLASELVLEPGERDEQKLAECADVLGRQSARLKKLIEDLIEASKAQTGNVQVDLVSMDAGVLLSQALGEWGERIEGAGLELVDRLSELPLAVRADGRLMGRVLDNLLGNVAKYGQPGTRVYVSLAPGEGVARMSLKNVSAAPLDVSAEELLERFVRGDSSRTTEGSGLGLSIAQSLMELQGGSLSLDVDADLFKVELTLPLDAGVAASMDADTDDSRQCPSEDEATTVL